MKKQNLFDIIMDVSAKIEREWPDNLKASLRQGDRLERMSREDRVDLLRQERN